MYTDADLAVGPARVHLQDQLGVPSQAGLLHETVVYSRRFDSSTQHITSCTCTDSLHQQLLNVSSF